MRMPRQVVFVVVFLAIVAAFLGFWAGLNAPVTESDVIKLGAALFFAETGGELTECIGLPGDGQTWIEVRCGDGESFRAYLFDDRGNRVPPPEEPST